MVGGGDGDHEVEKSHLKLDNMAEVASEIKLFGKWSLEEIEISDISLTDFIAVKGKHATYVAHTAGRYQRKRFRKAQVRY